ncbi:ion transporter [Candidatus Viridilinea mediisalina]|uniref:Ion transport domain-containing protein n=1 Tax=Candidatus Viridilinea mediisalina TaxID=2024553 RepID=A0A2A6RFY0_9CHLR|nr:ion transporter [Candidatus Viridilinea mediisalina]PDW01785.1 hypothetical protein CJ255_17350 [Candidatus Viridilinea mediisalina]
MSEPYPTQARRVVYALVEAPSFQRFIILVIVINALTLGLETSATIMAQVGPWLHMLDRIALAIFVLELGLKLWAYGWKFFRSGWNIFDFVIVSIALIPAVGALSVLRALRILRVLRLFSVVPSLRLIIGALIGAIPGMASILIILSLIFYVSAVLATQLFGNEFSEYFGSLGISALTLFQLMTLDSWSGDVVRPILEVYPFAWLFFIPFIVISAFAVLNLFIGVLISNIEAEHQARQDEHDQRLEAKLDQLSADVAEMRALLQAQGRLKS